MYGIFLYQSVQSSERKTTKIDSFIHIFVLSNKHFVSVFATKRFLLLDSSAPALENARSQRTDEDDVDKYLSAI